MSGRYTSPQWHSPALSQSISRDAQPAWLQTEPVELYAKALPKGRRSIAIEIESDMVHSHGVGPAAGLHTLTFTRSDTSVGARMSSARLELSTNAWLLTVGSDVQRRARVALGCAVLFAEDLEADEVVLAHALDATQRTELQDLAGAARLGVRFA